MKDSKLLVLTLLVGLFLIISSIVVFGVVGGYSGSIVQPANNTYVVIAGTYTFKGPTDLATGSLNQTINVTWFALPNGTASEASIKLGTNTTANQSDFTSSTLGITNGTGNYSITASFNDSQSGTGIHNF